MAIQTKDYVTLVREQTTAIQGAARVLVDLTIGSILRAVIEANAAVTLWLQGLILQLLARTRASTSSGVDLDSWVADYGLARLPAANASGMVTFSRFTPAQQAVVYVGTVVQTADGTQQYKVVADTAHAAFNQSRVAGGYVLAAGAASVSVPVVAVTAGAAGNAVANEVNTLIQAVPGVDTATNAAAFANGADSESDLALRNRFVAYIASLSKATKNAVGFAVASVQPAILYNLVENHRYDGTELLGYFYIVVDDGTGHPTAAFMTKVREAVEAVRPLTTSFDLYPPVVLNVNVSLTITTAPNVVHASAASLVNAAITSYINALPLGAALAWSRIAQLAYDASAGVTNVSAVLLNGATADIATTNQQTVKAGTITVV